MFERFSQRACRVIWRARDEAGRAGAEAIGPLHLLLGWILEDQCAPERLHPDVASGAVQWIQAEPVASRPPYLDSSRAEPLFGALVAALGEGIPKADDKEIPLSEAAVRALGAAVGRSAGRSVEFVHVLWGILQGQDSPATGLLQAHGITTETVEEWIRGKNA